MIPFHKTPMGQRFFEGTVPALVAAVKQLASAVEASNKLQRPDDKTHCVVCGAVATIRAEGGPLCATCNA